MNEEDKQLLAEIKATVDKLAALLITDLQDRPCRKKERLAKVTPLCDNTWVSNAGSN